MFWGSRKRRKIPSFVWIYSGFFFVVVGALLCVSFVLYCKSLCTREFIHTKILNGSESESNFSHPLNFHHTRTHFSVCVHIRRRFSVNKLHTAHINIICFAYTHTHTYENPNVFCHMTHTSIKHSFKCVEEPRYVLYTMFATKQEKTKLCETRYK